MDKDKPPTEEQTLEEYAENLEENLWEDSVDDQEFLEDYCNEQP